MEKSEKIEKRTPKSTMVKLLTFKMEIKEAIQEVRQIKKGEKKGIPLTDLLNEL